MTTGTSNRLAGNDLKYNVQGQTVTFVHWKRGGGHYVDLPFVRQVSLNYTSYGNHVIVLDLSQNFNGS